MLPLETKKIHKNENSSQFYWDSSYNSNDVCTLQACIGLLMQAFVLLSFQSY